MSPTNQLEMTGTVLIVDDHESGRFVKRRTLERAGLSVLEAATGAEALAIAARESPDVILLDVNLPDINGIEVTRRLRAAQREPPSLQILQISSTAIENSDRIRGLEQGADVYLTEPTDSQILIATVRALLRVRRAEVALASALESERRARQAAEDASRLKDEFLATLSHELRTPLNALMGWIWQLRHSNLDDSKRERALDSLERNAGIQAQLINDLLDISRIAKGKLHLEIRVVDLRSIVDAAVESVGDGAAQKHVRMGVEGPSVWTTGDYPRLLQVVTNLATNAVQFTPEEGRIRITVAEEGSAAVVRVQDTGAGIEPAFLPYVFDQFRQAVGGLSRKHGGLGLGLTVVQQIVELHGGSVNVTSAGAGHGATFTVCLPNETVLTHGHEPSSPLLSGLDLLLLEDDITEPDVLAAVLESSGAQVTVASRARGESAVAAARFSATIGRERLPSNPIPHVMVAAPIQPAQLVRSVAYALHGGSTSGATPPS
jgi:signal transduction histidine kinase